MRTPWIPLLTLSMLCLPAVCLHADEEETKPKYEMKIEEVKAQAVMTIRFKVSTEPSKISAKFAEVFTAVYSYVISNGGTPAGPPFSRYHAATDSELDIEAGLPVAKALPGEGDIKASELPAGVVVTTVHTGPYEKLSAAHQALEEWVRKNPYTATGGPWESYVTDPGTVADPNKWKTQLYMPVKKQDQSEAN